MNDNDGQWRCSVCMAPAPDYRSARGQKGSVTYEPVVALPCGHENPDGLTYLTNEHAAYVEEAES